MNKTFTIQSTKHNAFLYGMLAAAIVVAAFFGVLFALPASASAAMLTQTLDLGVAVLPRNKRDHLPARLGYRLLRTADTGGSTAFPDRTGNRHLRYS